MKFICPYCTLEIEIKNLKEKYVQCPNCANISEVK